MTVPPPREPASVPAGGIRSWFSGVRFVGIVLALIALTYPGVLFGHGTFVFRDYGFFNYPLAFWFREQFWLGEVPLWNPLSSCGIPFLAQWNTLACYPPSLIYLCLPLPWSLGLFTLLHWLLGAVGMYCLAHSRANHRFAASVAGMAYAFNGLTINCLMWPHMTAAIGWMPWVVVASTQAWRRGGRRLVVAAVVSAFQLLTGAPELILLTWGILLLMFLLECRQPPVSLMASAGRIAAVVLLMTGLSAVQLLPFAELLVQSNRDTAHFSTESALPPHGWVNLLLPLFRAVKSPVGIYYQQGQFWTTSYYCSIIALLLAGYAIWRSRDRGTRWYAAAALLAVIMAFGDRGVLYPLIRKILPVVNLINFPVKYLLAWTFLIPLLAAFGVQAFETSTAGEAKANRRRLLLLAAAMIAVMGGAFAFDKLSPSSASSPVWVSNGLVRVLYLIGGLALLVLGRNNIRLAPRLQEAAGLGVLLLIWLDVRFHAPEQNPVVGNVAFQPGLQRLTNSASLPTGGVSRLMLSREARLRSDRVTLADPLNDYLGHRLSQTMNCNLLDGLAKVDGFYPLFTRVHIDVLRLLYTQTNTAASPLADFLSVSHVSTPGNPLEFLPRGSFLPVVTAGQQPLFADTPTTLRGLASSGFDPARTVYLPLESGGAVTVTNRSDAKILRSTRTSRTYRIEVDAPQPAWLVLAETHYPSWRAEVNGHRARIWRANHAFQAIEVPAGRSEVQLFYFDRSFVSGLTISALTLCLSWLGWRRLRAKSAK